MRLPSIVIAIVSWLPAVVAEAAGPACGSFVLVGGEKGINVIDNPPEGKSPGDVRAGWRKLADDDGNPVGSVQFVATLTEPGAAGGDVLAGHYYIQLPDGFIAAQTVVPAPPTRPTPARRHRTPS